MFIVYLSNQNGTQIDLSDVIKLALKLLCQPTFSYEIWLVNNKSNECVNWVNFDFKIKRLRLRGSLFRVMNSSLTNSNILVTRMD